MFKIKIDPYFTFKKDGEKISFEDSFFFENSKLKSAIVFKKEVFEKLNSESNNISFPSIMESNIGYDVFEAGH